MHGPDGVSRNLSFQYEFSGKWLLLNVATLEKVNVTTIVGFNVYPQKASLEEQNRFELLGKSALQYATLALVVVLPLFTLLVLILCLRTRMSGRKWPWVLFIILGIGKLAVNWTTGEWNMSPASVQLFSASAFAPLYGPWTLAISLPVGAVAFLLRRRALLASRAA